MSYKPMSDQPIGIFDSGVGGTTVWYEIQKLLPAENTIYLADSKNAPYGEKSKEEIIALCRKNTDLLISKGCKIIVVACNTATTNAIDYLRENYQLPFIGIEPAIKPAALNTDSRKVGVLATKGTLASNLFLSTSKTHAGDIEVLEQDGDGLVRLIEQGRANSEATRELLKKYLDPMVEARIDHLVLGCTHYPYLIPQLKQILPPNITIIDCGGAVARQTERILKKHNLQNLGEDTGTYEFFINAGKEVLEELVLNKAANISVSELDF